MPANSKATDSVVIASVKASRENRSAMIKKFGFMPLSVLRISRGALDKNLFHLQKENGRQTSESERAKNAPIGSVLRNKTLKIGGGAGSRNRAGTWSIMCASLVEFFVKYYATKGSVYLDPFMGQGVQMQVAKTFGLSYWGMDCCKDFVAFIESVRERIDPEGSLHPILGDSRFPSKIPDGIGDFSFNSPPYWDLEDYGDDPEQLGKGHSYEEFLCGMHDVAKAWLPKFKTGAYHVVNVNDFKKAGSFYPYHSDLTREFCRAGWRITDTWIVEGTISGLPKVFAESFNSRRQSPKVHEYALVFRKP